MDNSAHFNNRGLARYSLEQYEECLEDFDEVRGCIWIFGGMPEDERPYCTDMCRACPVLNPLCEALRLEQSDANYYFNRGNALLVLKKLDAALVLLPTAIAYMLQQQGSA